jgi:hypothetical protein
MVNGPTPPASPTAASASTSGGVASDVVDLGVSTSPNLLANVPGKSLSAPTGVVVLPCAAFFDIEHQHYGSFYNFREHPRIVTALQLFAVVELVSVRAFLFQPGLVKDAPIALIRFGIVPRAITTHSGTTSRTASIPSLHSIVTNPVFASSGAYSWSNPVVSGGFPFPPGVQIDLRAIESRFNYAVFCLVNDTVSTTSGAIYKCQLDFVVRCEGTGFGAVY